MVAMIAEAFLTSSDIIYYKVLLPKCGLFAYYLHYTYLLFVLYRTLSTNRPFGNLQTLILRFISLIYSSESSCKIAKFETKFRKREKKCFKEYVIKITSNKFAVICKWRKAIMLKEKVALRIKVFMLRKRE